MHVLVQILLVSVGSALGGLARWGATVGLARWLGTGFPWGTFLINISGSLFLGWFATLLSEKLAFQDGSWIRPDDLRLLVAVGFTGAFTTFSTFEYESDRLLRDGHEVLGLTYLLASVFLGFVAVRVGIYLAR